MSPGGSKEDLKLDGSKEGGPLSNTDLASPTLPIASTLLSEDDGKPGTASDNEWTLINHNGN